METEKVETEKVFKELHLFEKIKPFMEQAAAWEVRPEDLFVACMKASLVKCYEFNLIVRRQTASEHAFFLVPSLRGICEDLIVLSFIERMPEVDRAELLQSMMEYDLVSRVKHQVKFFTEARPQQPIYRVKDVDAHIDRLESRIRAVWNRHGWPNLSNGTMPQIRQIADKQGQPVLGSLYDYLYRLCSANVHFNVQSLFRSGWGETTSLKFSTRNFIVYYKDFARVYGAFLFHVYFEFFGNVLQPSPEVGGAIDEIRKWVILRRWPEMVTFEEMNKEVPKDNGLFRYIMSLKQAEEQKGFIKK